MRFKVTIGPPRNRSAGMALLAGAICLAPVSEHKKTEEPWTERD